MVLRNLTIVSFTFSTLASDHQQNANANGNLGACLATARHLLYAAEQRESSTWLCKRLRGKALRSESEGYSSYSNIAALMARMGICDILSYSYNKERYQTAILNVQASKITRGLSPAEWDEQPLQRFLVEPNFSNLHIKP